MALVQQSFGAAGPAASAGTAPAATVRVTTTAAPGVSRLAQMQARFQKKQMEEKEQKLLRLYESQQQRAFQRVGGRGSAGSSSASLSSSTSTLASIGGGANGKVRQLFEERRSNGWDRSYPLEPVAGGGKARAANNNNNQHFAQQLPLAVPKTKVTRGASLDRSHAPVNKTNIRRSKSHAREAAVHSNGHSDDHNAPRGGKLYYDGGGQSFRKIPNNRVEDYNNRNYHQRRQPVVVPPENREDNYEDEEFEEDVNYETLGEDIRPTRNGNFAVLPDNKRQEELFAKYQVRQLGNHDLLDSSPPPDFYEDDGIDQGTFIYEKAPNNNNNNNIGGPLRSEEPVVNNSDRFKTYVSNKHNNRGLYKEEILPRAPPAMATKVQESKKAPAARRESLSPPTRAVKATPPKKTEQKTTIGTMPEIKSPAGPKTSTGGVTPKHSTSRPSSAMNKTSSINTAKASPTSSKVRNGPSSQPLRTAPSRDDLTECHICNRRFTNDRIKVHEQICSKTAQKKRKEYDATKHRVQGTEAEQFVKRALKTTTTKKKVEPKKGDWRKKHEEFIQTIRAAKEAQAHVAAGGKLSDLPPPPPLDTSDYVPCPHCGRRFNEGAAERHIPRCATMQHNKPKPVNNKTSGPFAKRR